ESIAAHANFPVKVIGYSEHVEQLMQAANVMISKLGGLTTFEALACRLPIIADAITPPMPQESGAANLLSKRGAGILLKRATDIVPAVRRLAEDARYYAAMRAATAGVAIPHATQRIVEEIAALIPAPVLAEEERASVDVSVA
ncbi:MAG TPA: glycosyltransferase, partial [Pyrinomonadaceae bacterium]|nr:glycosyltransferase [Pyrinomonadaceae bacterium]